MVREVRHWRTYSNILEHALEKYDQLLISDCVRDDCVTIAMTNGRRLTNRSNTIELIVTTKEHENRMVFHRSSIFQFLRDFLGVYRDALAHPSIP